MTTDKRRTYFVARYCYNDGCKGIAATTDVDCLPPTCLAPIRQIVASNKRDAIRHFRDFTAEGTRVNP